MLIVHNYRNVDTVLLRACDNDRRKALLFSQAIIIIRIIIIIDKRNLVIMAMSRTHVLPA